MACDSTNLLKLANASELNFEHRVITLAQLINAFGRINVTTRRSGQNGGRGSEEEGKGARFHKQFEANATTAQLDLLRQAVNNNLRLYRRFETMLTAYAEATNETGFSKRFRTIAYTERRTHFARALH